MHKWFRSSLLLTSLLVVSSLAFAQSDDDKESAKALRSAADSMSQLGQIGEGSDASCAKQFSVFLYCQASKLETGSKNVCAKPKCSFGNAALAELLNTVEEEDKAASAQVAPSPANTAPADSAGQSDSPILDEGNQQAAAIGDANAAKQQTTAQQRAEGQNAGQQTTAKAASSVQGTATQTGGASLPTAPPPAPLTVVFNHTLNWSQGQAHVVSTPPGIDCPTTCSASFAAGRDVALQATADSNSIVRNIECYAWTGGGTGPKTPGDSLSCVWPGLFVAKGGNAVVIVDVAGSSQQSMITDNGLPPKANGKNSGSSVNGSSGNSGGSGTSGGNSGTYLAPITLNCVQEFWDPKFYNWLSFQNDCGQAIHLTWIAKSPNDHFGGSSGDIAAGHSANTGWNKSEVAAKGDFALFVCPLGSIAVDSNTGQAVNNPNATYRCKKQ